MFREDKHAATATLFRVKEKCSLDIWSRNLEAMTLINAHNPHSGKWGLPGCDTNTDITLHLAHFSSSSPAYSRSMWGGAIRRNQ